MSSDPIPLSKFEAILVRLARAAVGAYPVDEISRQLSSTPAAPRCLTAKAVRLVEQALSAGLVRLYARAGWRIEPFVAMNSTGDAEVSIGRLWDRHRPASLGLTFSPNSLHLLIWLVAADLTTGKSKPKFRSATFTLGDRLLALRLYELFRESSLLTRFRQSSHVAKNLLIDLFYPEDAPASAEWSADDFGILTGDEGRPYLELLQHALRQRWAEVASQNRRLRDVDDVRRRGGVMTQLLGALCQACEQRGRRDLAGFLLPALSDVLRSWTPGERWFRRLDTRPLRMVDRATLYQESTPLLHHARTLHRWNGWARGSGYYDEDYQASQHFKEAWEQHRGDEVIRTAEEILQSFEALSV